MECLFREICFSRLPGAAANRSWVRLRRKTTQRATRAIAAAGDTGAAGVRIPEKLEKVSSAKGEGGKSLVSPKVQAAASKP